MKVETFMAVFVGIVVLLIGDFFSLRILIPKMISSENDFLVYGGFIWAIVLVSVHLFLVVWYFNRNKLEK